MSNQFIVIKKILWLTMAVAISLAILNDFSLPTLLSVFLTLFTVLGFLLSNKVALSKEYLALEAKAAIPKANDKFLYGKYKPTLKDLMPCLVILGLSSCYAAYLAAHGDKPTRLAKIVYQIGGVPSVVFFWAIIGTSLLAFSIENWLGYRFSLKVSPNQSFKRDA